MALLAFGGLIARAFGFRGNDEEPESILGKPPPEIPRCTAIIPSVPAPCTCDRLAPHHATIDGEPGARVRLDL